MRRILGLLAAGLMLAGCAAATPGVSPSPTGAPSTGSASSGSAPSASLPPAGLDTASASVSARGLESGSASAFGTASASGSREPTGTAAPSPGTLSRTPVTGTPGAGTISRGSATSTLAAPAAGTEVSRGAQADRIVALLGTLAVKGRAPKTGYDRAQFGPAWTDDVTVDGGHNGCDTRNDILRRDLTDVTIKPGSDGCTVLTGVLHDPYTGKTIDFTRGQATSGAVQIDHVVALLDAWQTGAQRLDKQQRENLANDPLNLQAVDGPTNERKGAGDAATWLPPNKSFRCTYVSRQVQVKAKYRLWVTSAEKAAIERVLATCGATVARSTPVPPPRATSRTAASTTTPSKVATSTAVAVTHMPPPTTKTAGCHPLSKAGNCYKPGQFCADKDHNVAGIDADGDAIRCVPSGSRWRWTRT